MGGVYTGRGGFIRDVNWVTYLGGRIFGGAYIRDFTVFKKRPLNVVKGLCLMFDCKPNKYSIGWATEGNCQGAIGKILPPLR